MRKIIWNIITQAYPMYLRLVYKMNIGKNTVISYKAKLDKNINPKGIYIGDDTWILYNAIVLSHDHSRGLKLDTKTGNNCVIGINTIILPGVTIGNHVVIGAGSVVTKSIENNSIAVGNPAKVIKNWIKVNKRGQIV